MIEEGYKATIDIMPEILKLFNRKPLKARKKLKYLFLRISRLIFLSKIAPKSTFQDSLDRSIANTPLPFSCPPPLTNHFDMYPHKPCYS